MLSPKRPSKAAPDGPAAQAALIQWLNTFPLDFKVESMEDLTDGIALSKALADIEPYYTPLTMTSPEGRMHEIYTELSRYIQSECGGLEPLLQMPGRTEDAGSFSDTFEALTLLLMAAVTGSKREDYVIAITQLDATHQLEIARIIQWKQDQARDARKTASDNRLNGATPSNDDFELEFEARFGSLIGQKKSLEQERDRLMKQLADMRTRLERLQTNNEVLQRQLAAAQEDLRGVQRSEESAKVIKNLEARIREQEELIAHQEGYLEQEQTEKAKLEREAERLASVSRALADLKTELGQLKDENHELQKKANIADRYKRKIASQRTLEEDIKNLQLENEELRTRLREFEMLRVRNESLEETHTQFQNTLQRHEMEIFELTSQKSTIDDERQALLRQVRRLEEKLVADELHINELQERLAGRPSSSGAGASMGNLEDELEQTTRRTRNDLEVSRLRAEVQLLKGNASAAQEANGLRIKLEEAERIRLRNDTKYSDLFEKHVIAQQQIAAILDSLPTEKLVNGIDRAMIVGKISMLTPQYCRSEMSSNLRVQFLNTLDKLSATERKAEYMELDLENAKRELLKAHTDLSMISKEDKEALEELKASQETLVTSLENENSALRSKNADLKVDYEQQNSQLIQALIAKDKLQQAVAEAAEKASNEEPNRPGSDLEESKQLLKEKDETIQQLHGKILELEATGPEARQAELTLENARLKRENDLIASAWYDLNSRIQSNLLLLQRRPEAPRTMIKQQRLAVGDWGRRSKGGM